MSNPCLPDILSRLFPQEPESSVLLRHCLPEILEESQQPAYTELVMWLTMHSEEYSSTSALQLLSGLAGLHTLFRCWKAGKIALRHKEA